MENLATLQGEQKQQVAKETLENLVVNPSPQSLELLTPLAKSVEGAIHSESEGRLQGYSDWVQELIGPYLSPANFELMKVWGDALEKFYPVIPPPSYQEALRKLLSQIAGSPEYCDSITMRMKKSMAKDPFFLGILFDSLNALNELFGDCLLLPVFHYLLQRTPRWELDQLLRIPFWNKADIRRALENIQLPSTGWKSVRKLVKLALTLNDALERGISLEDIAREVREGYECMVKKLENLLGIDVCPNLALEYLPWILRALPIKARARALIKGETAKAINEVREYPLPNGKCMRIDPQNLHLQMKALTSRRSCISPGRGNFNYALISMVNPYVFYATIIDENGKLEGRTMVFIGVEKWSAKPICLARASGIYPPELEKEEGLVEAVDKALEKYALERGVRYVREGIMNVPLLTVYGDGVRKIGRGLVEITSEKRAFV